MRRILAAVAIAALAGPAFAQTADDVSGAIDNVLGDHREFERAFVSIQAAVQEEDAAALAEWVAYPLTARIDGDELTVEDADDFVAQYDAIIAPEIADVVANQKYEELFVNDQGVMFGSGQLWISGICSDDACEGFDVRIITVQTTGN